MALFGTDGVRGKANQELTPDLALQLGKAFARYLKKTKFNEPVIIGKDTRISSDMLEAAVASGIASEGFKVIELGVVPTAVVSFLCKEGDFSGGVMVSASHNPFFDNGIKFFNWQGFKLSEAEEEKVENLMTSSLPAPTGEGIGDIRQDIKKIDIYVNWLKSLYLLPYLDLRIVLDCANGSTSFCAPKVFSQITKNLIILNNTPDGTNINLNCGSTDTKAIQQKVKETHSQVGFAFDGDGDRVIAIDEEGAVVDGDQIIGIIAVYLKQKNQLKKDKVVTTIMSNLGLEETLKTYKIALIRTPVGDRNVLELMLREELILGGEQSGHIILLEKAFTGDGLLTALQVLEIMYQTGKTLRELASIFPRYPQLLINVPIRDRQKFYSSPLQNILEEEERTFSGRIVVRPSGTQPLIRVMVEGKDYQIVKEKANKLVDIIKRICVE